LGSAVIEHWPFPSQVANPIHGKSAGSLCVVISEAASRLSLLIVLCCPDMKMLSLALLAVASAFGQKVQMESDQAVDFSRFKTFAIVSGRLTSANPSLNNDLIKKRIEADIQKDLQTKGLTLMASGPSDLQVRYTLGASRGVETEAYPAGWRGWGTRVVRVPYAEGTLVIDLRDASTHSLVWRAIARENQSDASKIEPKLDSMVKKAFDKYPPKRK